MKTEFINCQDPEEIISFLNKLGVKSERSKEIGDHEFNRVVLFKVYGVEYKIVWYINESILQVGDNDRAARIPFKFMYYDTTFPLVEKCASVGFSYRKNEVTNIWDSPFPYDVFRIPLELN